MHQKQPPAKVAMAWEEVDSEPASRAAAAGSEVASAEQAKVTSVMSRTTGREIRCRM